jgi:uncharacterized protein
MSYDRDGLIQFVGKVFQCDWQGLHGIQHWTRVAKHGKTIGKLHGLSKSDLLIVELFSYLHDSCRQSEGIDRDHGQRAAVMALDLNGLCYDLNDCDLERLCDAIAGHSFGGISKDVTIQTCWDADRLDLGRVGIVPSDKYLSKLGAQFINSAFDLSLQ